MKKFIEKEYRQYRDTPYYTNQKGDVYNIKIKRFVNGSVPNKKKGHIYIQMGKYGKAIAKHRMIAECWLGDIEGKEVHHIDENPKNNKVNNLVILTNEEHQRKHNRSKICVKFSKDWKTLLKFYNSLNEADQDVGGSHIYEFLMKGHKYKGFNWIRLDNTKEYPIFVSENVANIEEQLLQLVDKEIVKWFAWTAARFRPSPRRPYSVSKDAFNGLHYS